MSSQPDTREIYEKPTGWILGALILFLIFGGIHSCCSIHHVENYALGYTFDRFEGKIEKLDRTGWFYKMWPRYKVYEIDLRPHQIALNANQRVLNAKLVQFDPKGLDTFVKWHGAGAGQANDGMTDNLFEILKCYAFNVNDGRDCPFLIILDEMEQKVIQAPEAAAPSEPTK
jgi:hypothetical protein